MGIFINSPGKFHTNPFTNRRYFRRSLIQIERSTCGFLFDFFSRFNILIKLQKLYIVMSMILSVYPLTFLIFMEKLLLVQVPILSIYSDFTKPIMSIMVSLLTIVGNLSEAVTQFRFLPANSLMNLSGNLAFSNYKTTLQAATENFDRFSQIGGFKWKF
ncbi:MAG: hypothetical protein KatS3mg035_0757 [Bacteroidia bacterium]|nr:MAG: hypothetical protein KatS3mg035_0757 [Bacteroidia bacterium]